MTGTITVSQASYNRIIDKVTRLRGKNARLRELLLGSFWLIPDLKDGDSVVFVGAHVVKAKDGMVPAERGFVQWGEEDIEKKLFD